jgi:hypothetical protein
MYHILVTSQASLIVGVLAMILLVALRRHRDEHKKTSPLKISTSFFLGVSVYTLIVLLIGHFWLNNMTDMISAGFGEARVAWLLLGLTAENFAKLYSLYDP